MLNLEHIQEPSLEFGFEQLAQDPKVGLTFFGPHDAKLSSRPGRINSGLIGTSVGVGLMRRWSRNWLLPVPTEKDTNPKIWPIFPGFESVFGCQWDPQPTAQRLVDVDSLSSACELENIDDRVKKVVDIYLEAITAIKKGDERIDLLLCIVPDFVFNKCRPLSAPSRPQRMVSPQLSLFDVDQVPAEILAPDFRRQIKARAMAFGIPLQIIRESTLAWTKEERHEALTKFKRGLTPAADRAWNLATTAYYKAGGKPWKLNGVRDGVCYIGLAYRLSPASFSTGGKISACCAAQMFLQDGDGVIFKGEEGVWYSKERNLFHLERSGAQKLLAGVLSTYQNLGGKSLTEVFLHCPSGISYEEFEGFKAAVPFGAKVVAVRVRRDNNVRVFRNGDWPLPRGHFWQISERSAYLWASGFKYGLATYDGTEIPIPLRVDILHGEADVRTVVRDILGLTKLNYNACKFGESEPVTIKFADAVGEILISNPGITPMPQFKFYI